MQTPPTPKLTPQQRLAVTAFMSGMNNKQVSEYVGVHWVTVSKWKKLPQFQEALEEAQEKQLEFVTRALLDASPRAVEAIHDALDFSSDASDIDVTSMFKLHTITVDDTGEKIQVPVLDFDKMKKSKKFVKKIKSDKNGLTVEVVDVVQAKNLGLRAAELILRQVLPFKGESDYEERLAEIERKLEEAE